MLVVVPALVKPGSKMIGWTIPVLYEEHHDKYIPYFDIKPVFWIKEKTTFYPVYDIDFTNPNQPRVWVHEEEGAKGEINLKTIVDTFFRPIGELELTYSNDLVGVYESLEKLYDILVDNLVVRPVPPLNYLVYDKKKDILTRLYYVESYKGKAVIKASRKGNVLLEVSEVKLLDETKQNLRAIVRRGNYYREIIVNWMNVLTGGTAIRETLAFEEVNELEEGNTE